VPEYKTKDGRPITFRYYEQAPDDQMGLCKGYICHRVEALVDGVLAGYLKIAYVPHEGLEAAFPTIWDWTYRTQGWCFNRDTLDGIWRGCHHYAHRTPASLRGKIASYLHVRKSMIPDPVTMQADLDILEHEEYLGGRTVWDRRREWEEWFVDRPYVDYMRVYEGDDAPYRREGPTGTNWRRQGIATALYDAGARWLAQSKGFPLHGGLQTDEAMAVWDAMEASGRYPIDIRKKPWDDTTGPVLDYTGETA